MERALCILLSERSQLSGLRVVWFSLEMTLRENQNYKERRRVWDSLQGRNGGRCDYTRAREIWKHFIFLVFVAKLLSHHEKTPNKFKLLDIPSNIWRAHFFLIISLELYFPFSIFFIRLPVRFL